MKLSEIPKNELKLGIKVRSDNTSHIGYVLGWGYSYTHALKINDEEKFFILVQWETEEYTNDNLFNFNNVEVIEIPE